MSLLCLIFCCSCRLKYYVNKIVRDYVVLAVRTLTREIAGASAITDGPFQNAEEEVPKWQYQSGRFPKQDVIRDVQTFGSWMHLRFADAQTVVNLLHPTECAKTADTIRV